VLAAAAENGKGIFPDDLLGDLKGTLGDLSHLKDMGLQAATDAVKNITDDVQKKLDEEAEKAKKKLEEGIGNLLGGGGDKKK
jgi:hypothetical protein